MIWLSVRSLQSTQAIPFVPLAHMHLTSPLPIVHLVFNKIEAPRTWKASSIGLFSAESEQDALNIGAMTLPTTTTGESGRSSVGQAFGICREPQSVRRTSPLHEPFPVENYDCLGARSIDSDTSSIASVAETGQVHEGPSDQVAVISKAHEQTRLWVIVALTVGVITVVVGPATFLVVYLFGMNTYHREGSSVQTSASLSHALATSQAISTVVSLVVPLVMTVHAYQLASDWLKVSRDPRSGVRPTPLQ